VGGGCQSARGIPRNGCTVTGFGFGSSLELDPITGGGEILCPEVLPSTGVLNTGFVERRGTKSLTRVVATVKGFSCSCVAWTGSLCRRGWCLGDSSRSSNSSSSSCSVTGGLGSGSSKLGRMESGGTRLCRFV